MQVIQALYFGHALLLNPIIGLRFVPR
jgi:hypothetical protein